MADELVPVAPDEEMSPEQEAIIQQFYTAASQFGTSGSPSLDVLLQKGLYGKKMPPQMRGKKAADAFQQAFELIGGIPRLALWADKNPDAFFSLYSKMIPSSVKADVTAKIIVDAPWMNPNRLSYRERSAEAEIVDIPPTQGSASGNPSSER